MLEKINSPEDLKKLSIEEKKELAEEIRKYILEIVSENGGHLASNLGVVELTIALHSVFDLPKDKIVWDVGHQSYVHKMLTGRKEQMDSLRKYKGLAGFPKTCESEYDVFNTGYSSTSVSVGTGIARARDLLKEDYNVIAVIGDGSLTGGMAEEALNLFLTNDNQEALNLTDKLNEYNRVRQEIEKGIYEDAIEKIKNDNIKEVFDYKDKK